MELDPQREAIRSLAQETIDRQHDERASVVNTELAGHRAELEAHWLSKPEDIRGLSYREAQVNIDENLVTLLELGRDNAARRIHLDRLSERLDSVTENLADISRRAESRTSQPRRGWMRQLYEDWFSIRTSKIR